MIKRGNYIMLLLLISLISCTNQVKYIGVKDGTIPVSGTHLIEISAMNKNVSSLPLKSTLYRVNHDTMMITMVDKTKDNIFNQEKDLFVVSDPTSPYVPVYVNFNPNVANVSPKMLFSFKGKFFQVNNVSENGEVIDIKYIISNNKKERAIQACFEDVVNAKLKLKDVYSNTEQTVSAILAEKTTSNKYTFFHFWYTSCPPCIEEIPFLTKLEERGVAVINIALPLFDDKEKLIDAIDSFNYPGDHFWGDAQVVKNFGQNGFPYGVLVESATHLKLFTATSAMEAFSFLFNE